MRVDFLGIYLVDKRVTLPQDVLDKPLRLTPIAVKWDMNESEWDVQFPARNMIEHHVHRIIADKVSGII